MLQPDVAPGVEDRNFLACSGISGCLLVPLAAIAMKTRLGEIIERIFSSLIHRDQVIHCKTNILPSLVGMAVFTQEVGALANLLLNIQGEFTRHEAVPGLGIALSCEQGD